MTESSCCQEDGYSCGPFESQEREIEDLRAALIWAMDEIDALSNKLCGFAYPQGMGMLHRAAELDNYTKAVKARAIPF